MEVSFSSCLDCSQKLYGRSDKRFCNDYCRNSYHGKRNRDTTNFMRNVNNAIRKNRRILEHLAQSGQVQIAKEQLIYLGYQIQFSTQLVIDEAGNQLFYCYEYGILESAGVIYIIDKRESPILSLKAR